jgi:hypothetical protein
MELIIAKVKQHGGIPTRDDIAQVLRAVAAPGDKLDEKRAAVRRLFDETGHNPYNGQQGYHVDEDLGDYDAY